MVSTGAKVGLVVGIGAVAGVGLAFALKQMGQSSFQTEVNGSRGPIHVTVPPTAVLYVAATGGTPGAGALFYRCEESPGPGSQCDINGAQFGVFDANGYFEWPDTIGAGVAGTFHYYYAYGDASTGQISNWVEVVVISS
jgi:hypothetical protein